MNAYTMEKDRWYCRLPDVTDDPEATENLRSTVALKTRGVAQDWRATR